MTSIIFIQYITGKESPSCFERISKTSGSCQGPCSEEASSYHLAMHASFGENSGSGPSPKGAYGNGGSN